MEGPPPGPRARQKLDVQLEGLAAYQAGAAQLKAGEPLAVRASGGRLECVTQAGTPVGLIPADKRNVLSRGPWAGTVRSVKRRPGAAAASAAPPSDSAEAAAAAAAAAGTEAAASQQPAADSTPEQQQGTAASAEPALSELQQCAAVGDQQQAEPSGAAQQQPAAQQAAEQQAAVVQVLVRFVPEEQLWERQGEGGGAAAAGADEDWDAARLSREQFEALGEPAVLGRVPRWGLGGARRSRVLRPHFGAESDQALPAVRAASLIGV